MLMVLTMAVSAVMTGCGNADEKENAVSKETSSQEKIESAESSTSKEEVEELEPVTLKYWLGATETEDTELVEEAVNEYLAEVLPNTTLDLVYVPITEYKDRWQKAMAAQEAIDLAWHAESWMSILEEDIEMGGVMPIEEYVEEYGQGIIETLGQDVMDNHRSSDGHLYCLVSWQGLVGERYGIYLPQENVDLLGADWAEDFQEAIYESDKKPSYDEESKATVAAYLEEYLAASKEAGKLGLGLNLNNDPMNKIYRVTQNVELAVPACIYPQLDGDTIYLEATSSPGHYYWKRLEIYHDWYEKGYIREDVASAEIAETTYSVDTKDNNYITRTHNAWADGADKTESVKAGYDIACFYNTPAARKTNGFGTGTVVPATAKNPERAIMLMNLIYTDPTLYHMIVYGIEGTHYTKNADGTITYAENKKYEGPSCWMLGTCLNSLTTDASQLDYYQKLKEAEEDAWRPQYQWSGFDNSNVKVEISNIAAISKEYSLTALVPLDNWKELKMEEREKLHAAGIEKVIKEYYNQLLPVAEKWGLKVEIRGF